MADKIISRAIQTIFHFIVYYLAWILGIYFAAQHKGWLATSCILFFVLLQILWQYCVVKDTRHLLFLVFLFTVVGTVIDNMYFLSGLIIFAGNPFAPYLSPPWMIALWMSFALVFFANFKSFFSNYLLLSLLALFGFALAYYAGAYLKAAYFPYGSATSILVGVTWAFCLPLCMWIYNRRVTYD